MAKSIYSKPWFVYIAECKDKTLYTGIAIDVERRIHEHSNTNKCRYTRSRQPVVLKYKKRFKDHAEAWKREARIKKLNKKEKLKLIAGYEFTPLQKRRQNRKT
ncbi:MAG: GIY-YIG nuclease family protein [Candidatus Omnitrophica bacterium]|jgi:putative endonuclease|nr:GIY-YIG nuclease family protein [Candidatus Omnitrophota bacterium]MDD5079940.1 GIY-YIG nuclease family protein [Candidatus Omnitrophota bacterium]